MRITTAAVRRALTAATASVALAALVAPGTAAAGPRSSADPTPPTAQGRSADADPAEAPEMADVAARAAAGDGATFTPINPVRVLDTREAIGVPGHVPVGPGGTVTLNLSNAVPANAISVVLNVTGVTGNSGTYITAYPAGYDRPDSSNVNLVPNSARSNAVTVLLGSTGAVNLFNFLGDTHIVADLAGYYQYGSGSLYNAKTPLRILDTRNNGGPIGQRGTRALRVRDFVPATADAVVLNLTGVTPTIGTYVTAYPGGAAKPEVSSLNLVPGQVAPNLVTVPIGKDGNVNLYNHNGSVHLVADLAGYYDTQSGAEFYPSDPFRLVDTRTDPDLGLVGPDEYVYFPLGDVFGGFTAMMFNLTGTEPSAGTYLTAYPLNRGIPFASNLNLAPGETAANLTITAFDSDTTIAVSNRYGYSHMLWDFAGAFGPIVSASS
ncbi:hypothetical protein UO65_2943 [Actinokineospora spheciospongiae]|uniref:Uncharacterized protein n=1 Tax=Actinokineospora spheciospongiae TaxID=909613 RepID=W7IZ17_9PSEU|nr:hypothetical protein [Actinokineospora spheciospongiae]EWC61756.1 hypothetical protein UO65_2943 [Actinokineospora spheciospongiae]